MNHMRSTTIFISGLAVMALILGFNYFFQPLAGKFSPLPSPSPTITDVIPTQVDTAETVAPEVKIRQLLAAPLDLSDASSSAMTTWITQNAPGTVTLFGEKLSASQVSQTITALKSQTVGSPPLIAVDHEGGSVQRLSGEGYTVMPSWQELCAQPATVSGQILTQAAAEVAASGVNIVLAPVVDVARQQPVLKSRVCSGDPVVVAERGLQAARIWQQANVMPVLKHFPGIGGTTRDLHRRFDQVTVSLEQAKVYQAILTSLPGIGVMMSHAGVVNQYPDIPCSLSSVCVTELTNTFSQALVVSDALEMAAAAYVPTASGSAQVTRSLPDVAVQAVLAGNNVLVFGPSVTTQDLDQVIVALTTEYQRNGIFRDRVDQSWRKITTFKQVAGQASEQ